MQKSRPIRSFVRRDSRMTEAQKGALKLNWSRYAIPTCATAGDLRNIFARNAPVTLEIGSGDGTCVLALADRTPDEDFVAVEVYRPGLGRLLHRAEADGVLNLRVSDQDICDLLEPIRERVFDRVLIFFPDPWPKKRHFKRRLLRESFFDLIAPRLHRHGRVFVATDCASYAESIVTTVDSLPGWVNLAGPQLFSSRATFRPITKFERRALTAGSIVYDFAFALR